MTDTAPTIIVDPNGRWAGQYRIGTPGDYLVLNPTPAGWELDTEYDGGIKNPDARFVTRFTESCRILRSKDAETLRKWLQDAMNINPHILDRDELDLLSTTIDIDDLADAIDRTWVAGEWLKPADIDEIIKTTPEKLLEQAEKDDCRILGGIDGMREAVRERLEET